MSQSTSNSGETTPTGVLTPSTVVDSGTIVPDFTICHHKEPKTDEEILQRISELRLALSVSKRSLISPFPDISVRHPTFGSLKLSPGIDSIGIKTKANIPYITPHEISTFKPAIVTAIKGFSKPKNEQDLCLFVSPTNQKDSTFDMQFVSWKENTVKDIEVDWLEIPEEHANSGLWQHGEHSFDFIGGGKNEKLMAKIKFSTPFSSPPDVVIWISGIHALSEKPLTIYCIPSSGKTTKNEFEAYIETWNGTKMCNVKVSWVAYDKNLKGVHSGLASTYDFRTADNPQHFNTHYTEFPPGKFKKAPKVMVGVTRLSLAPSGSNVKVFASNVSLFGMCWNAYSWGDTRNYGMGLTYLALEDWRD